jgi:hypothetical protein
VRAYELIVNSTWLYAARTVGVLGLILYLSARNALAEQLRRVLAR